MALVGVYHRIKGGGEVEEGKFGGFRLCQNKISLKALYFSKFSPVISDQFSIVYPLYILQYIYIYIYIYIYSPGKIREFSDLLGDKYWMELVPLIKIKMKEIKGK